MLTPSSAACPPALGQQTRADEAVDLLEVQTGVGDCGAGGFDGLHAQRPIGAAEHLAVRVADDGDLVAAANLPLTG